MRYKDRVRKLERESGQGWPVVIFLEQCEGRLYRKDGTETTIARERESYRDSIIIVDNIADAMRGYA